ncbi:MAG TPA: amidohydrolase family protein [Stellaceae bacterium]|nr:amidohydrolase family protein [Stellaceae bacterium]
MTATSTPIDIHTHIVPASLPAYVGAAADIPWPSIRHTDACHAQVIINGKNFRDIDDACWSLERRLEHTREMGIGIEVLSPMPELLSYWLPAKDASVLARYINEQIAAMVQAAPERYAGLGMVPLQDLDLAIEELGHVVKTLGLLGVELATNIDGKPLGDPAFDPFFAAVVALDAAVFVHPLRPAGMDRIVGPRSLEAVLAYPCETALAIGSMITGCVLDRHPKLRIAFSHGGGGFGQVLPRLQHSWSTNRALQALVPHAPAETARRFYYDSLVYSETSLRFLIELFGVTQIVLGTDHPFGIMEKHPVARIDRLALPERERALILSGNARRFLGLDPS